MEQILEAFNTGGEMLWKALWALIFGYIISSAIQVIVTREQMAKTLGDRGWKQAALAGFFGFISSSCSFAALAASRSIWVKGAYPVNAISFLVAAVNLVIELGIVLLVLLGAGVMAIWDVPIIDPILSIGISLFVLWNVGRNLTKVMKVFLQNTPSSFDLREFEEKVQGIPKVERTHHIHAWSFDGESHVMSLHLQMASDASREEIVETKRKVREALDEEEFEHVTIDVELEGEDCASCDEEGN